MTPIISRVKNNRRKWRSHVERMEEGRSPKSKMMQEYTPMAKRSRRRPRKKLMDTWLRTHRQAGRPTVEKDTPTTPHVFLHRKIPLIPDVGRENVLNDDRFDFVIF